MPLQACESPVEPRTPETGNGGAERGRSSEPGFKSAAIVTGNEEERIDEGGKAIEVVPAWRFPLNLRESAEK